jgi:hypothetical protein
MRGLGFSFQKGKIRVTVLDRSPSGDITFGASKAVQLDPALKLPELADRYISNFRALLHEYKPTAIAARLVWESESVDAAVFQILPVGLLASVAHQAAISFRHYTPQALSKPTPFGLPKGATPISAIDSRFGTHPPYWDNMQKHSVLVVWRALLEADT